jgi:hypothetical protein
VSSLRHLTLDGQDLQTEAPTFDELISAHDEREVWPLIAIFALNVNPSLFSGA